MVPPGWRPHPISWVLGLSVYDEWRQQCTTMYPVTGWWSCCPMLSLGDSGNSILVWYHLSTTCIVFRSLVIRRKGLESGLTAQEQHTPFPFTPHWPVLTSQSSNQPATKAGRTAPELFTEHSTSLGRISRKMSDLYQIVYSAWSYH